MGLFSVIITIILMAFIIGASVSFLGGIEPPSDQEVQAQTEWVQAVEAHQWDKASEILEAHPEKGTKQWLFSRAQISLMQGNEAKESLATLSGKDLSLSETLALEALYEASLESSEGVEPIEWLEATRSDLDAYQFWLIASLAAPAGFLLFVCVPMGRNHARLSKEVPA